MNEKLKRLVHYLEEADNLDNPSAVGRWSMRVGVFLREAMGDVAFVGFTSLKADNQWDELALRRGYIEGLLVKFEEESSSQVSSGPIAIGEVAGAASARAIFLVHGHDGEAKETVARFLEKLELEPIILHEQPNQGRTLIEKFETSSRGVAFAVVLLTPDDLGGAATGSKDNLNPRARQNVILELGYFMGRLCRTRVCALYRGGVELPSDFQGVVYIEFDSAGAWRIKLAQEFIEAKLPIKLEGLINK